MHIEDNLDQIDFILRNNGMILIPADGIWCLACNACSEIAVSKLIDVEKNLADHFNEIIVSDLSMLKKHVIDLHPRIETMLTYHARPLKLLYNQGRSLSSQLLEDQKDICARIVKDSFSYSLIKALGNPLYIKSFLDKDDFALPYEGIATMELPTIDYLHPNSGNGIDKFIPIIIGRFDEDGMLSVLK